MSSKALEDAATDDAPTGGDPAKRSKREPSPRARSHWLPGGSPREPRRERRPYLLDPEALSDYIDPLYRAACALCGSRHEAEDLVQETFTNVLKRPRLIRDNNEIGYLLQALRHTYASRWRAAARRPATRQLFEADAPAVSDTHINAREIMEAIATAPAPYRDAVIAVDVLGLSYREAARSLRAREATITTRLHRGRQHVARELIDETTSRT
jgi:RNA polymerase sigma-70 factor, ECF subfamily